MVLASLIQFAVYIAIYIILGKALYLFFSKLFLLLPKETQAKILKDAVELRRKLNDAVKAKKKAVCLM